MANADALRHLLASCSALLGSSWLGSSQRNFRARKLGNRATGSFSKPAAKVCGLGRRASATRSPAGGRSRSAGAPAFAALCGAGSTVAEGRIACATGATKRKPGTCGGAPSLSRPPARRLNTRATHRLGQLRSSISWRRVECRRNQLSIRRCRGTPDLRRLDGLRKTRAGRSLPAWPMRSRLPRLGLRLFSWRLIFRQVSQTCLGCGCVPPWRAPRPQPAAPLPSVGVNSGRFLREVPEPFRSSAGFRLVGPLGEELVPDHSSISQKSTMNPLNPRDHQEQQS